MRIEDIENDLCRLFQGFVEFENLAGWCTRLIRVDSQIIDL